MNEQTGSVLIVNTLCHLSGLIGANTCRPTIPSNLHVNSTDCRRQVTFDNESRSQTNLNSFTSFRDNKLKVICVRRDMERDSNITCTVILFKQVIPTIKCVLVLLRYNILVTYGYPCPLKEGTETYIGRTNRNLARKANLLQVKLNEPRHIGVQSFAAAALPHSVGI